MYAHLAVYVTSTTPRLCCRQAINMRSAAVTLVMMLVAVACVSSSPIPGGRKEKFIIHVPIKYHTIHHYVVKKIPVIHHIDHHDYHHHHHHHHPHEHEFHHHDHDFHHDYHDGY